MDPLGSRGIYLKVSILKTFRSDKALSQDSTRRERSEPAGTEPRASIDVKRQVDQKESCTGVSSYRHGLFPVFLSPSCFIHGFIIMATETLGPDLYRSV